MDINLTHYFPQDTQVLDLLRAMSRKLDLIIYKDNKIMTVQQDIADALAKVQADVTAQTTVVAGVSTYIQGLQAQIAALAAQTTDTTTAAALTALATQIEANTASDTAAILVNTPPPATDPNAPPITAPEAAKMAKKTK